MTDLAKICEIKAHQLLIPPYTSTSKPDGTTDGTEITDYEWRDILTHP